MGSSQAKQNRVSDDGWTSVTAPRETLERAVDAGIVAILLILTSPAHWRIFAARTYGQGLQESRTNSDAVKITRQMQLHQGRGLYVTLALCS